jgi:hypothetical protein
MGAQQNAQQRPSVRLLSRFGCASVSVTSLYFAIINHLSTDTYKGQCRTVDLMLQKQKTSRRYAAEYRDPDGKQTCRNLGTTSKTKARRMALEIQQELESGVEHVPEANLHITDLVKAYFQSVQTKGRARKTEWKYRADLDKLKAFCMQANIVLARRFSENHLQLRQRSSWQNKCSNGHGARS